MTDPDAESSQNSSPESSGEFSSGFDGRLSPGPRRAVISVDLRDALGDRVDAVQQAALDDLQAKYAEVVNRAKLRW